MAQELKYRIVVVGQRAAMSALKKFQRFTLGVFRSIGRAAMLAFKIGIVGGIAGIISGGYAAIKAAASYEQLQVRLEAVLGSAKQAAKMFKELRKFAASTPLQLEDLVKAKIILEGVGVTGMKAFKGVAETSAAMGKSIEEVALAVASLENETLKRLGIQLRMTGDEFRFTFRDKAGNQIEKLITGIDEARIGLTEIFSTKFGGGLERASETLTGRLSTFVDKFKEIMAQIGDQMLPSIKRGFAAINTEMDRLAASGLLSSASGLFAAVKGIGSLIIAAFKAGGLAAAAIIVNKLSELPFPFGQGKSLSNDPVADAFKKYGNAFAEEMKRWKDTTTVSAGSDPDIIAEINALQKIRNLGLLEPGETGGFKPFGHGPANRKAMLEARAARAVGNDANGRAGGLGRRSPKALMMERMGGAMGSGTMQEFGLSELFDRARGQTGRRMKPGESKNTPLYVEEVKPEGKGLQ